MIPVQFITSATPHHSHEQAAKLALKGGCKWIQLRVKDASDEELEPIARRLLAKCREVGAAFIIDDRVELVKKIEADGVHLGKNDMSVSEARGLLGEGFIIGGTANSADDIRRLKAETADYIGLGPFRFTTTKKNLSPILGIEGYRRIMDEVRAEGIDTPVVAIGGITPADVSALMQTGVNGIAVSGAVATAADPAEMMRQFINAEIDSER